jgi:isopropylmalate/homocitrate/citramalate synthase
MKEETMEKLESKVALKVHDAVVKALRAGEDAGIAAKNVIKEIVTTAKDDELDTKAKVSKLTKEALRGAKEGNTKAQPTVEDFLKKNLNTTLNDAVKTVEELQNICAKKNKTAVIYISMAFGTPYGEPWSIELVLQWVEFFDHRGVEIIALSDIIASSTPEMIAGIFSRLPETTNAEIGLHLHTVAGNGDEKIDAAYRNGCRRFDSVINGAGGCPMTGYEMVGNLDTKVLVDYFDRNKIPLNIDRKAFRKAIRTATVTYGIHTLK